MRKNLSWKRLTVSLLMVIISIILTGCGGGVKKHGIAKINSTPAGAEIVNLKDSSNLGLTPGQVLFSGEADTSEFVRIQLRKLGYKDRITSFWINKRHATMQEAEEGAIDIHVELEKVKE